MSEDFFLAGDVVREFQKLGNVARAMVLKGMEEYAKQTFGLEEFEIGSSSGGSGEGVKRSGSKGSSNKDNYGWYGGVKSANINVNGAQAKIETQGYSGLASVLSELSFTVGEDDALISFEIEYSYTGLSGAGVCTENANVNDWIHLGDGNGNGVTGDGLGLRSKGSIDDGFNGVQYKSTQKILVTKERKMYFWNDNKQSIEELAIPAGTKARFYVTLYFAGNGVKSLQQTILKKCPKTEEEIWNFLKK